MRTTTTQLLSRLIFLSMIWLALSASWAQQADPNEDVAFQFPGAVPVSRVLLEYERLTGLKAIKDGKSAKAEIELQTTGTMKPPAAADFIEKTLLLNGHALVPSGVGTVKLVSIAGTPVAAEGVQVITRPDRLPAGDEVVSYIMPLNYLDTKQAGEMMGQIVKLHPYGSIVSVPDAGVLVITESSATIRSLLALQQSLDVPPSKTIQRAFQLERSDAVEVAEDLQTILGLGEENRGSTTTRGATSVPPELQRGAPNATQPTGNTSTTGISTRADARIHPIPRTNRILVVARPIEMEYIASLIEELDAPTTARDHFARSVKYVPVAQLLAVARDALLRGAPDSTNGSSGGGIPNLAQNQNQSNQRNNNTSTSGFGNSTFGNSQSTFGGGSLQETQQQGPISLVVGKTLLIADTTSNDLIAYGAPDHLETLERIVDHLDKRPRQVQLSVVIGQLTLGDGVDFGLDLVRSVEGFDFRGRESLGAGSFKTSVGNSQTGFPNVADLQSVEDFGTVLDGLSAYGQIGSHLNAYLRTLSTTNRFQVLSRPTIFAENNKRAIFETGQRIAVPVSSLSTIDPNQVGQAVTSSIDFQDVLLKLEVIPLINANDEVTLQISQTNDSIVGQTTIGGNEIPTIGTQGIETTVIVPDGSTVLLGGLVSEGESDSVSGLPLFTKIPLLKHLFGSTSKEKDRTELVIFIQPMIIDDPSDLPSTMIDQNRRTEIAGEAWRFANPGIRDLGQRPLTQRPQVRVREEDQQHPLLPLPRREEFTPAPPLQRQPTPKTEREVRELRELADEVARQARQYGREPSTR